MTDNTNTELYNTGYYNTGDFNTGDFNTGDCNTGNCNSGDFNSGRRNTGDFNTGNFNSGRRNTGDFNTGNFNTGFFNTTNQEIVRVFNNTEVKRDDFINAIPNWFCNISITTWVSENDMTDQEKIDNPTFSTTGGYLRKNDLKTEWKKAFEAASPENIQKARDLPGFDYDIFEEITGLDLRVPEDKPKVDTAPIEIIIDGVKFVRAV